MSLLSRLFGGDTKRTPAVQARIPENPLLNRLRGITPVVSAALQVQQSEAGKRRFLDELGQVRKIVAGLEAQLTEAARRGQHWADIYQANSGSEDGLRGLSRAVFDYLRREGFDPVIWWVPDAVGGYYVISITW